MVEIGFGDQQVSVIVNPSKPMNGSNLSDSSRSWIFASSKTKRFPIAMKLLRNDLYIYIKRINGGDWIW